VTAAASHDYDWVVVGSGFGGSVAALRLAQKGYRVAVIEQGRRYRDGDFARSAWQLRRMLWAPRVGLRGIMQVKRFRDVTVIGGVGVGGGSLVYANTLYIPHSDDFYRHAQWAELADWRAELAPHYAEAQRMLGVVEYAGDGQSECAMRAVATTLGVGQSYRTTPVGVYFGEPGVTVADPYFGGSGPPRTGCVRCGQCMLGCRYGAKNTLVKNYLWEAERLGVEVVSDRAVVDVAPIGAPDGSDGYSVTSERSGAILRRGRRRTTARGVVLAAGTLGTNTLLRRCRDRGSLPRLSDRLGHLVRTNSEAITAVTARSGDYSGEIAITASIYPDAHTHVTNNTYGGAGDVFALNFGPLTSGSEAPTAWLPVANLVAEVAAREIGGIAQSAVTESLFNTPTTAHFLGGATIGTDARSGVVDRDQSVFGYRNMVVCDGAAVPANIGVNPSLTIAALAERSMSRIPAADRG